MTERFDIVICGLGPTGLETAAALAQEAPATLRVAALEARREIVLPHPLGFWADQAEEAGLAGLARTAFPSFLARTHDGFEIVRALERRILDGEAFVRDRLARAAGRVEIRTGVRVLSSWHQPGHIVLETDHGPIRAAMAIDAGGQGSVLSREAEIAPPGQAVRRSVFAIVAQTPTEGEPWLLADLLDPERDEGLRYVTATPAREGTRFELVQWRESPEPDDAMERQLDAYLRDRGITARIVQRGRTERETGGLRRLARGRILFAGSAAGLLIPWTGDGLVPGIRSARAAARVAVRAAACGPDADAAARALLGIHREVHEGDFGVSFRFQDVAKDMVPRMPGTDAVRLYEVFYQLPDDLLAGFLACRLSMTGILRFIRHYWRHYRFEEIPWHAAVRGGIAALSAYARMR